MAQVPASDSRCGGHVAGGGAHRARGGMAGTHMRHNSHPGGPHHGFVCTHSAPTSCGYNFFSCNVTMFCAREH